MSALGVEATRSLVNRARPRKRVLEGLFGTWGNCLLTVLAVAILIAVVPPLFRWLVFDATWSGTSAACAQQGGACWTFVAAKLRFIFFAFYPSDLLWRPALTCVLLLTVLAATAIPRFWGRGLIAVWLVAIGVCWLLMSGAWGSAAVPSSQWGGLAVTLLVWTACFAAAVPSAIMLALARRSTMTGLRWLAIAYIEFMRSTPMVAILYIAMLILPMALPAGQSMDKLLRAMVMITLFWTAYIAEVVRGGLQAVPTGQKDAAASLGLSYWRIMQYIVLPQALRIVIPGLVTQAIGFLLATSLLAVIGIFEILNAARSAATDPNWLGYYDEAYFVVAVIYFVFGYAASQYSVWLERKLGNPSSGFEGAAANCARPR